MLLNRRRLRVFTVNTSSRLPLAIGKEYVLFASRTRRGFEIGDDCGPLSQPSHVKETLREIAALSGATSASVEGVVLLPGEAEGDGVKGVGITVTGGGRAYETTSDAAGQFRIAVPPGRYRIRVEPNAAVQSDYNYWTDLDGVHLVRGQCAQVQFVARSARRQAAPPAALAWSSQQGAGHAQAHDSFVAIREVRVP